LNFCGYDGRGNLAAVQTLGAYGELAALAGRRDQNR
jgi:hypothetical protein